MMKDTPVICNFCQTGRLVVKLPKPYDLLICTDCIDELRKQYDDLVLIAAQRA